jgi:hypothetical protein
MVAAWKGTDTKKKRKKKLCCAGTSGEFQIRVGNVGKPLHAGKDNFSTQSNPQKVTE